MIPLKRVFDEKRRLVVPIAAGLAINVLLYGGGVYPLKAQTRSAEIREQNAAATLAAATREEASARGLVQGKSRTDVALQSFYRDVLPSSLASARNMTYLRLAQLAERHHLRSPHRSAEAQADPQAALRRLRVAMALEGNYDDIRQFIHELEIGTDFIVIDGVTLTQGSEPGGSLQLTLNLSTYYRHGT